MTMESVLNVDGKDILVMVEVSIVGLLKVVTMVDHCNGGDDAHTCQGCIEHNAAKLCQDLCNLWN